MVTYSAEEQTAIAAEHERLPLGHPVRRLINDFHALRNACGAIARSHP